MTEKEFLYEQKAAIERMKQMNKKSIEHTNNDSHKMPPVPSFIKMPQNTKNETENKENHNTKPTNPCSKSPLGIPVLDNLFKDGDTTLIIGLLLILLSEKSDKLLLFALLYILL